MYESPITLIYEELQSKIEEEIYRLIEQIGIEVDKDELIKALKYDRGQYEKGYADAEAERKKGYWIGRPIAGYATVRCSVCTELFFENEGKWNFCPNCGAKMEE